MKNIVFAIIFMSGLLAGNAQTRLIEKGDDLYSKGFYSKAVNKYLKELENSDKHGDIVYPKLGLCYANLHAPVQSIKYFKKAQEFKTTLDVPSSVVYAKELIKVGDYKSSKELLDSLYVSSIDKELVSDWIVYNDWAIRNVKTDSITEISKTNIKTSYSVSGVNIIDDKLMFSRSEDINNMESDDYDFVFVPIKEGVKRFLFLKDSVFVNHQKLPIQAGSQVLDKKNNVLYFSANAFKFKNGDKVNLSNQDEISKNGINPLAIWSLKLNDTLAIPKRLSFNDNRYDYTHPFLSGDGKRLYFTSNKPRGNGGYDIYYMEKDDLGAWTIETHLGEEVNTKYDESYASYDDQKDVFIFSRKESLNGYGGWDLFSRDKLGNVKNLGLPINSSYDDFSYKLLNNSEAYYVSNRFNEKGNDEIYYVKNSLLEANKNNSVTDKDGLTEYLSVGNDVLSVLATEAGTNMPLEGVLVDYVRIDANTVEFRFTKDGVLLDSQLYTEGTLPTKEVLSVALDSDLIALDHENNSLLEANKNKTVTDKDGLTEYLSVGNDVLSVLVMEAGTNTPLEGVLVDYARIDANTVEFRFTKDGVLLDSQLYTEGTLPAKGVLSVALDSDLKNKTVTDKDGLTEYLSVGNDVLSVLVMEAGTNTPLEGVLVDYVRIDANTVEFRFTKDGVLLDSQLYTEGTLPTKGVLSVALDSDLKNKTVTDKDGLTEYLSVGNDVLSLLTTEAGTNMPLEGVLVEYARIDANTFEFKFSKDGVLLHSQLYTEGTLTTKEVLSVALNSGLIAIHHAKEAFTTKLVEGVSFNFDFDSAKLSDESKKELTELTKGLAMFPEKTIVLEGHTDSRGSKKYNKQLSLKRINSVKTYSVRLKISKKRFIIVNHGEESLMNNCTDGVRCDEGAHAKNRVVVLKIK